MAEFVHAPELSLFAEPLLSQGISKIKYVDYRPVAQLTDTSVIDFNIPGVGSQYLDLKNTRLHMKLKIVKPDGSAIDEQDTVGFVATPLHSMFSQVDIFLQQENITSSSSLYPFKAYTEKLLGTCTSPGHPQSGSELYILDGDIKAAFNNMDQPNPNASAQDGIRNSGLYKRSKFTSLGRVIDLEGPLHCDISQQERYILNAVDLRVRLYPSQNAFRLMTNLEHEYHVQIVDAYLRVCKVCVSPEIILAHNEVLQNKPAIYPHYKSAIKTYTVPRGQYTVNIDDPFQGTIPSKLYVFFVGAQAFSGEYQKNPFYYYHYDVRSAGFYVDGNSVPNQPLETNFNQREIVTAYNALLDTAERTDPLTEFDITPQRFMDGFTILAFNLESNTSSSLDYWVKPILGHSRLELRFGTALPESINIMMMGVYPQVLTIDKARNVSVRTAN